MSSVAKKVDQVAESSAGVQYAGFAAGIASGWTKLIVGHPFDTIKTRLQCSSQYSGALDCLMQTVKKEGALKLYAGALAPFFGWSATDSVLMGSLHNYRIYLKNNGLDEVDPTIIGTVLGDQDDGRRLTLTGHAIAGMFAGFTKV